MSRRKQIIPIILVVAILVIFSIFLLRKAPKTVDSEEIGLTVAFLNVGKADCIVLTVDDFVMLVDTGTADSYSVVSDYLAERGVTEIDYVLLTHLDQDHIGGVPSLLNDYTVQNMIQPDYVKDNDTYEAYVEALAAHDITPVYLKQEGDISLGDGNTIHLYPPEAEEYEQSNDYSIVSAVYYGDYSFLLMGDAEKERMQEILDQNPGVFTVLKIPHHGDYKSILEQLISLTAPQYCVVSTSADNLEEKMTECLDYFAVTAYYTFNGTVIMKTDGTTFSVIQ
ncbi:MAG: MBL fold metallo-hydrolase [Lachnospiraceae bacterium]|nr:MBL fold metallo-hydrolase [Lachnospiraceae bacterium]